MLNPPVPCHVSMSAVLDDLLADFRAPEGSFYTARDADSEGEEGIFYVWTPDQIEAVLGPERALAEAGAGLAVVSRSGGGGRRLPSGAARRGRPPAPRPQGRDRQDVRVERGGGGGVVHQDAPLLRVLLHAGEFLSKPGGTVPVAPLRLPA